MIFFLCWAGENVSVSEGKKEVQKSMNHGIEWMELALLSRFFFLISDDLVEEFQSS